MVALNTAYAAPKNAADPKNRVGDFFYEDHASVGKNRWASRLNAQEKSCYHYETASGRSNWPNRDPIQEAGFVNTYVFNQHSPELNRAKSKISALHADIVNASNAFLIGAIGEREAFKAIFIGALRMRQMMTRISSILPSQVGINSYQFIGNQALSFYDFLGMHKGDKWFGYGGNQDKDFRRWYHRQVKESGDPDIGSKEEADALYDEWVEEGKPDAEGHRTEPEGGSAPEGECKINDEEPDGLWDALLIGVGAGAGAALIGGQLGPQVAAPEEIVTVPIGAVFGGIVGLSRYVF